MLQRDEALYSDMRGYPRARLDSFPSAGPRFTINFMHSLWLLKKHTHAILSFYRFVLCPLIDTDDHLFVGFSFRALPQTTGEPSYPYHQHQGLGYAPGRSLDVAYVLQGLKENIGITYCFYGYFRCSLWI